MTRCYIRTPLVDGETGEDVMVQCCCNCQYHLAVHFHCTTEPKPEPRPAERTCVCPVQKGWACASPAYHPRAYDNWPEHSVGCEEYEPIKPHEEVTKP